MNSRRRAFTLFLLFTDAAHWPKGSSLSPRTEQPRARLGAPRAPPRWSWHSSPAGLSISEGPTATFSLVHPLSREARFQEEEKICYLPLKGVSSTCENTEVKNVTWFTFPRASAICRGVRLCQSDDSSRGEEKHLLPGVSPGAALSFKRHTLKTSSSPLWHEITKLPFM